jgi:hypothetical protein
LFSPQSKYDEILPALQACRYWIAPENKNKAQSVRCADYFIVIVIVIVIVIGRTKELLKEEIKPHHQRSHSHPGIIGALVQLVKLTQLSTVRE